MLGQITMLRSSLRFEKGQKIASTTNAAMGLSVPLSIGAAVASNKQILSVTGDGSIELNIQELKTISHYNLNIKTFVLIMVGTFQ